MPDSNILMRCQEEATKPVTLHEALAAEGEPESEFRRTYTINIQLKSQCVFIKSNSILALSFSTIFGGIFHPDFGTYNRYFAQMSLYTIIGSIFAQPAPGLLSGVVEPSLYYSCAQGLSLSCHDQYFQDQPFLATDSTTWYKPPQSVGGTHHAEVYPTMMVLPLSPLILITVIVCQLPEARN